MPTSPKRERWTEADVLALPPGEHDYFERKSGRLFDDTQQLLGTIAKALSALANTGGGHVVLGVADDGSLDGAPPRFKGRTTTRDWLEQRVPQLVEYALTDFRVHEVERDAADSEIPPDKVVIVIDVGDSAAAPHQCAYSSSESQKHTYYFRQGGRSEPAPHFYLELLRQRLTRAVLEPRPHRIIFRECARINERIFVILHLVIRVENIGRYAAYKWAVQARNVSGLAPRTEDYIFNPRNFPLGEGSTGIRIDDTLLPGNALDEPFRFGVWLQPWAETVEGVRRELEHLLAELRIVYRLLTETGVSDDYEVRLGELLHSEELAEAIMGRVGGGSASR